jgi:hypothetical protein
MRKPSSLLALALLPLACPSLAEESQNSSATEFGPLVTLNGSLHPLARRDRDQGRVDPETPTRGVSIVFRRWPAQQGALETLLAEQQDPSSPNYRRWLSPDQFAERFGLPRDGVERVTARRRYRDSCLHGDDEPGSGGHGCVPANGNERS